MPDTHSKLPKVRWLVLVGVVLLLALQFGSYALFAERKFVESLKTNMLYALAWYYDTPPKEKSVGLSGVHLLPIDGLRIDSRYYRDIGDFVLKYSDKPFFSGDDASSFFKADAKGNVHFMLERGVNSLILHCNLFPGKYPLFTRDIMIEYETVNTLKPIVIDPKPVYIRQIWLFGNWHTYQQHGLPYNRFSHLTTD